MKRIFHFKRKIEARDILNISVILLLIGLFAWIGVNYASTFGKLDYSDLIGSAENMRQFILSYGNTAIVMILFMHLIQVVISFIPSVLVQFVGGMIFGMGMGMLTGIIGIAAGTAISFYLTRLLGRRVMTLFISEQNIQKIESFFAGEMSSLVLLVLFILPTPKDFFAYFVGLTNMKASRFFILSAVGRLPGMLVATYLGAHVFDRNYVMIAIIAVASSSLFLVLMLFRDKILSALNKRKKG